MEEYLDLLTLSPIFRDQFLKQLYMKINADRFCIPPQPFTYLGCRGAVWFHTYAQLPLTPPPPTHPLPALAVSSMVRVIFKCPVGRDSDGTGHSEGPGR